MQGGSEPWTSTIDMLTEERNSLRLIVDTIHTTLDHYIAGRSSRNGNENDNNTVATETEIIELLNMLPQILNSAVAPAILQQKEKQRQSMTIAGVARPPLLSRQTTLCRLLFSPLLLQSSSSLSSSISGESEVLVCLARVIMFGRSLGNVESSIFFQEETQQHISISTTGGRGTQRIGSITLAALQSLGDIVHMCLYDATEEKNPDRSLCSTSFSFRTVTSSNDRVEGHIYTMLRGALRRSLCQTGLFNYLWHSVLFQPLTNTQRVAVIRVLYDVSCAGVLRLPVVIGRMRHLTSPAVWGEQVVKRILSDTSEIVKERLAFMLYEGLYSMLINKTQDHYSYQEDNIYWRRWLTNISLQHLLSIVATGASFNVLWPVLGTLQLALEQEQLENITHQQRTCGFRIEHIHLEKVVEVCATRLVHLFTGPSAINTRDWDITKEEEKEELRTYRLLVRGSVLLLRLALRGVDHSLSNNHNQNDDVNIAKGAILVLRTCIEKQVMAAVLKGLEKPPNDFKCSFVTQKMRAEFVRFVRDLIERASPPLFFLTYRLIPYLPRMLQIVMDVETGDCTLNRYSCVDDNHDDDDVIIYHSRLYRNVCNEKVEVICLLGVIFWYSPLIREQFTHMLNVLQCTLEQRYVLFNVMETIFHSIPSNALEDLLIIDMTGIFINELTQLCWVENKLQLNTAECPLLQQQQQQQQRGFYQYRQNDMMMTHKKTLENISSERQWVSLQLQRGKCGPKHSSVTREFIYFILQHIRNGDGGINKNDENYDGINRTSVSIIQTNSSTTDVHVDNMHNDAEEKTFPVKSHTTLFPKRQENDDEDEDEEEQEEEEEEMSINNEGEKILLQSIFNDNSSSTLHQQEQKQIVVPKSTKIFPCIVNGNTLGLQRLLNQCQVGGRADEEKKYNAAFELFAFLAKRYYRHLLTPQAALEYLRRQQNKGSNHYQVTRFVSTPLFNKTGRNNSGTTLRLWTALDVRRDDLFFFSLPLKEINETSLVGLLQQCREHQGTLRKALRTAPQTPRGRRWFLQDAATNIMGRLIAIFQVLLQLIQREGVRAVQEALTRMPLILEDEDTQNGPDGVTVRCATGNVRPQELHCGTLLDVVKFIVQCFSGSAKSYGVGAGELSF